MERFEIETKGVSRIVMVVSLILAGILVWALMGCSTAQKVVDKVCPACEKCVDTFQVAYESCEDAADRLEDIVKREKAGREICEEGFARSMRKGW